jgi:hypothetical protein
MLGERRLQSCQREVSQISRLSPRAWSPATHLPAARGAPPALSPRRARARARAPRRLARLSNGRLEGLNGKIRLISHRSFGRHCADSLLALVYLCCTGIVIELPR